jgi:quinol monooxygenase YgiN
MIVVIAKVSVIPEKKKELLALAKPVIATTQTEAGCISYILLDNPYDPGGCMFVEEWTDLAALQAHAAAPHIAQWRKDSRDLLTAKTAITIYQGDEVKL